MWHARLAQHYRHSTGVVAFGRFVQGCSSRSEAHVAGQDLTTLLGHKYMQVGDQRRTKKQADRYTEIWLLLNEREGDGRWGRL